jgi:hypothetical protein
MTLEAHPSPERRQVRLLMLFGGLAAGPAAWTLHLMINYALASHICFPGAVPPFPGAAAPPWLSCALAAIGIVAVASAIAGALISYRIWQTVRHERSRPEPRFSGHAHELVEIGEGRTRFLALWGMITGTAFAFATLFDLFGLLVLAPCG